MRVKLHIDAEVQVTHVPVSNANPKDRRKITGPVHHGQLKARN